MNDKWLACVDTTKKVAHALACIRVADGNPCSLEGWSAGFNFDGTQLSFTCTHPRRMV